MGNQTSQRAFSQRQLRVGELVKQNLGELFIRTLTEYSHLVRKALSKRLDIKFLPKLTFVEDNSFEYAEKIEKIIKKNKEHDKEKKIYN